MATSTQIPVEEYLRTSYHPDCEYVDGEMLDRNVSMKSETAAAFEKVENALRTGNPAIEIPLDQLFD